MCNLKEKINEESEDQIIVEKDPSKIYSTIAMFNNFSPEKPISGAVIYFWESHTKRPEDVTRVKATEDLIYKQFNVSECEKYEVRTGYLSRHNHLKKPWGEASPNDVREAIEKGLKDQEDWLARCNPKLPGFVQKDWKDCILIENNLYYQDCKKLIVDRLESSPEFLAAYMKTVEAYTEKHGTLKENGEAYILEEIAWIMSLSLCHLNKQIYLIHVGNDNPAIKEMFRQFPNLAKAVRWLSPRFREAEFSSVADFLMYYKVNNYAGCSFASENPDIVMPMKVFSKNNMGTKEQLALMLNHEQAQKEFLLSIIGQIPGHVYWLNRDNVYIGCNDLQAQDFGLSSREEVIGKTNRDLFSPVEAEALDKVNRTVMDSGKMYEGEENAYMYNKRGSYLSRKIPLFDLHGKVTGLLGLSIDVTDRKRVEALEVENKLQESRIRDQEAFRQFVSRVAHDITSPLVSLEHFVKTCENLTEKQHVMLRGIVTNIRTISDILLMQYKNSQYAESAESVQSIPVRLALQEIASQKEQEYEGTNVKIHYELDLKPEFTFIKAVRDGFDRMISNLVNNAADALGRNQGVVEITTKSDQTFVEISVKDSGKGMPKKMVDSIIAGISVGTTKATGHGIGMNQVRRIIDLYGGKLEIDSTEGVGTTVTVKFKKCEPPEWFTNQLHFKKGTTVLVLDNDESMHKIWYEKLSPYDLNLKFFSNGQDLTDFVFSLNIEERNNVFLLSDYDLRSTKSGLVVIMECGLQKQSAVVTGIINDMDVFELAQKLGLKVYPKLFINYIEIIVD